MTWNGDALDSLLQDLADLPDDLDLSLAEARPESVRLFDDSERDALTPAACGYLLELRRRGLLDADELELVIHSIASRRRPPVDRPELSAVVDHLLLGGVPEAPPLPAPRRH